MADAQSPAKGQKVTTEAGINAVTKTKPTSKVFTVVEVLENLLSNLSLTELTRMERVCSLWQNLIHTAPGLQERRFFKARTVSDLIRTVFDPATDEEYIIPAPSIMQHRPTSDALNASAQKGASSHIISTLHPYLSESSLSEFWIYSDDGDIDFSIAFAVFSPCTLLEWVLGEYWEGAYITQPPCKMKDVDVTIPNLDVERSFIVACSSKKSEDDYATLGDLRRAIQKVDHDFISDRKRQAYRLRIRIKGHLLDCNDRVRKARQADEAFLAATRIEPAKCVVIADAS